MESNKGYEIGGIYLIKKSFIVYEIEVLAISKRAYKIKWDSGNSTWSKKEDFDFEYKILERLK